MFTNRRLGFTLVELLLVLAILAVLAAILYPVFASARHRARMMACASNLHQISLALHQYAVDADNDYPPNDPTVAHTPHLALVWTLLIPYTHSVDVFHCPEAQGKYEAAAGYDYVNGSLPYFAGDGPVVKAPRPGSGTVVAGCGAHTQRDGPDGYALDEQGCAIGSIIIVREDGSTGVVQGSQTDRWIYHQGQWMLRAGVTPLPGDYERTRFPGEEWPPQD